MAGDELCSHRGERETRPVMVEGEPDPVRLCDECYWTYRRRGRLDMAADREVFGYGHR